MFYLQSLSPTWQWTWKICHQSRSILNYTSIKGNNHLGTCVNSSYITLFPRRLLFHKCRRHHMISVRGNVWTVPCISRYFSSVKSSKKSKELSRLFNLAKPEKWRLIGAVGLLLISSSVTMAFPFCIGKIIDVIFSSTANMKENLTSICTILTFIFILGAIANFGRVYLMNISAHRIINRLRTKVYDSILKQEVSFFDKTKTGELINRLSSDASVVGMSLTMNISDGLRNGLSFIIGASLMVYTSPQLTLLSLSIVPPVAFLAVMYGRFIKVITQKVQDSLAAATQAAEEHISNIRLVRAFAQEEKESIFYKNKIFDVLELAKKESLAKAVLFGSAGLSGNLIALSVLYYGGNMLSDTQLTVGGLSSFLMYAAYVGISIGGLSSFYAEVAKGLGASTRLWELIDRQPVISLTGGNILSSVKGDISFEHVNFLYPMRPEVTVLKNLSLNIPAGLVQAVVGTSGSGKSTLGALLLRFYDPDNGQITLDGADIKTLNPQWLRSNIGIVPQEPFLFSCSLRENITYGRSQVSPVDDDEVIQVLKEANAWEFVRHLPEGLNTTVGERGLLLSGGQRQRIAIARALLKNPKILILDEATSALDSTSEHLIQEALECVMKDRTVIVIAHRLSTIKQADNIIVLHKGCVVEQGTYDELVKSGGMFSRLTEQQAL